MKRRTLARALFHGAWCVALVAVQTTSALAESYPNKTIKLIVAQAPGGRDDTIARVLGHRLSEFWNQPVVIINHGGAGGTIGAEIAASATADGYTLFLGGSNTLAIAPAMNRDLSYNPVGDFVAIGGVARVPYALAVNARVPVHTVSELVAYARARPGGLNYGSSGYGSTSGLAAELLKAQTGVDIVPIPYKGIAPALARLVSGDIDVMFADLSDLKPQADAGALRLIAAAGAERSRVAPELPTVGEQGIKGLVIDTWCGLFAPAETSSDVVATLSDALTRIMQEPEFRRRLELRGFEPFDVTSQALTAMIESDIQKYSAIIQRAGIKASP